MSVGKKAIKAETATLTAPKICCSNSLLPSEVMKTQFIKPDAAMKASVAPTVTTTTRNRILPILTFGSAPSGTIACE